MHRIHWETFMYYTANNKQQLQNYKPLLRRRRPVVITVRWTLSNARNTTCRFFNEAAIQSHVDDEPKTRNWRRYKEVHRVEVTCSAVGPTETLFWAPWRAFASLGMWRRVIPSRDPRCWGNQNNRRSADGEEEARGENWPAPMSALKLVWGWDRPATDPTAGWHFRRGAGFTSQLLF